MAFVETTIKKKWVGVPERISLWEKNFFSDHNCADNSHVLDRAIPRPGFCFTDFVNDIHAVDNLSKDRVFGIEVVVVNKVDKELAPPGIGAGICHGDRAPVIPVAFCELIFYYVTRPAPPGAGGVASLDHKSIDDPVEDHAIIIPFLNKRFKVARGDGHISSEGNGDIAHVRFKLYQFLGFGRWCHGYCPGRGCGLSCRWCGLRAPRTEDEPCNKEA